MRAINRFASGLMLTLVVIGFAAGCDSSSSRVEDTPTKSPPDPLAWFDELSRRATQRDTEYVRAHTRSDVLTHRPGQRAASPSAEPTELLCDALVMSFANAGSQGRHSDEYIVAATQMSPGLLGGSAWEYTVDLEWSDPGGWRLASWPHHYRTLSNPNAGSYPDKLRTSPSVAKQPPLP